MIIWLFYWRGCIHECPIMLLSKYHFGAVTPFKWDVLWLCQLYRISFAPPCSVSLFTAMCFSINIQFYINFSWYLVIFMMKFTALPYFWPCSSFKNPNLDPGQFQFFLIKAAGKSTYFIKVYSWDLIFGFKCLKTNFAL